MFRSCPFISTRRSPLYPTHIVSTSIQCHFISLHFTFAIGIFCFVPDPPRQPPLRHSHAVYRSFWSFASFPFPLSKLQKHFSNHLKRQHHGGFFHPASAIVIHLIQCTSTFVPRKIYICTRKYQTLCIRNAASTQRNHPHKHTAAQAIRFCWSRLWKWEKASNGQRRRDGRGWIM